VRSPSREARATTSPEISTIIKVRKASGAIMKTLGVRNAAEPVARTIIER
jgi:hypothetical protein